MNKVLIVITLYNLGDYVDDAVNSVLNQSYENWELIIINDGSTEYKSKERIKFYSSHIDKRIHTIDTENQGVVKARNNSAKMISSDYLCFLDADDKLRADFLEKCLMNFWENNSIGFVTSDYQYFGQDNSFIDIPNPNIAGFLIKNAAHTSSLIKREAFEEVKGYDSKFTGFMDWDLWLSIIEAGYTWKVVKEPIFEYRVRETSMITKSVQNYNNLFSILFDKHKKLYLKYYDKVILSQQTRIIDLHKEVIEKNQYIDKMYEEQKQMHHELVRYRDDVDRIKNTKVRKIRRKIAELSNNKSKLK